MNTTLKNSNKAIYGCDDMEAFVDSVVDTITYQACGASMIIAGLMSDAQEQMAHGDTEGARQTLNRAKHLMFRVMDGELVGTRGR